MRTLCPRCARGVRNVCIVPYPNCIVVPSINNSEPREYQVWSPSKPPSPSQPGHSLLASPEAKQRNPPPSRRSNTPCTLVSQPRGQAGRHGPPPLRPPVVHLYRCSGRHIRGWHRGRVIHSHGAGRLHAQHQSRGPKERAPKTTVYSRQNEKERNTIVQPICLSMALEGHSRHLDGFHPSL